MDFTQEILANRRALLDELDRRIEAALRPFADALDAFLGSLFQGRLPGDWRRRWHNFVADQATKEFFVEPRSIAEFEAWIEAWARFCDLLPRQAAPPRPEIGGEWIAAAGLPVERPPQRAAVSGSFQTAHSNPREQFFNDKLAIAEASLDEIRRTLTALGDRLDAAQVGEEVDVESEATAVEELVFRYHDALESARGAWLRDDLSREANARLLAMLSPASLGLQSFFDEQQRERAQKQELAISQRMRERDMTMDRIVLGARAVEGIGTAAGVLAGGGIVYQAAKKGGRWAVVKTLAIAAAAAAADQAAEAGARALGAGEQTIKGFRLAAIVVTLIILHRRAAASGTPAQAPPTNPAASSKHKLLPPQVARRKVGIAFNKARAKDYPYNEVPIAKSGRGKPYFLDSYDPTKGEIVFRRDTQFSEIQFKTVKGYFREFLRKYSPGRVIANVPSAKGLAGQQLEGKMIFEVQPQWKAIPKAVLNEATRLDIWIRDTNGRIYNPH